MNLYLEEGAAYFKIEEADQLPAVIDEGANNTNQPDKVNPRRALIYRDLRS